MALSLLCWLNPPCNISTETPSYSNSSPTLSTPARVRQKTIARPVFRINSAHIGPFFAPGIIQNRCCIDSIETSLGPTSIVTGSV